MEPRREKAEEKQQNWDGDVWDQEEKRQKKKLKKKRENVYCVLGPTHDGQRA